jgi:ribosome-binding factor A
MTPDPKQRKDLLAHCGELRDDDGVDPRYYSASSSHQRRNRKTQQLCHQVAQALSQILSSEFDDDLLLGLSVLAVEPAPNESQLLVTLHYDGPEPADHAEILRRLTSVTGFLRAQVAAAITRKRAPQLAFRLTG